MFFSKKDILVNGGDMLDIGKMKNVVMKAGLIAIFYANNKY